MLLSTLLRYLPEVLRSNIGSSPMSVIQAEMRHVTCIFLGLPSLSSYKECGLSHLQCVQTAMLSVQQPLRQYEGALAQFRMDEKGKGPIAFYDDSVMLFLQ